MDGQRPKRHTDREYEQQLQSLRHHLLRMAGRVEEMIADAVRALAERSPELARQTIAADAGVNRAEIETDDLCLMILARWQPMASDLRSIALALKMVTDLERIGDLAVNICERAIDLSLERSLVLPDRISEMATLVRSMIHDAIDAFVERDTEKARSVVERDDRVDEMYIDIFRQLLAAMVDDPASIERAIHLQSVAKWLERIGDHAENLAEQVVFMVKGKDIRHAGKLGEHHDSE